MNKDAVCVVCGALRMPGERDQLVVYYDTVDARHGTRLRETSVAMVCADCLAQHRRCCTCAWSSPASKSAKRTCHEAGNTLDRIRDRLDWCSAWEQREPVAVTLIRRASKERDE